MELIVHQQVYYSNREAIPIREIAESLLGLEAILQQSSPVFENLFPGCSIQKIEVFLDELRSDSLWEDVVVKFVFGNQKKFDEFIENMRERCGMDNISSNNKLLGGILIGLVLIGGIYSLTKDKVAEPSRIFTIEGNNNQIINVVAQGLDMDAEKLRSVIEDSVKDKGKLARDAARFIKPAKRDSEATVTFNNYEDLRITSETVRAMPSHIAEPELEQHIEDFENVALDIRAVDLDSLKKGWAGVIPEISEKRVRLQLDPGVDPSQLMANPHLRVNVTVVFESLLTGEKQPKLVFVRAVVDPQLAHRKRRRD